MRWIVTLLLFNGLAALAVGRTATPSDQANALAYVQTLKKLTDVMVSDVTGPCAAARYYAYANLAAYEIVCGQARPPAHGSFVGLLNGYPDLSRLNTGRSVDVPFASRYALLRMGEELLPSGHTLEAARTALLREAEGPLGAAALESSRLYAEAVVKALVQYAAEDGYVKTSGYLRYTPFGEAGAWQPTPPGYLEAYEPHWGTVRAFLLDSAAQFRPTPPVAYSERKDSPFYRLAREVYQTTTALSPEQTHIANFWDCNPFFLRQKGHVSFGTKKISPGGHWMGITGIACAKKGLSLAETVRWHALVGITMGDAFISCWNEKYRSNRVRPETFINAHLDPAWRPLLQTPPFPEYSSGHSVVSGAVSTLLTTLAGEDFAYTDTTEVEFGVPARSFSSFTQAAREAAISRLYGGIHFRDAVENGMLQGEKIGHYVVQKLKLKQ